MLGRLQRKPSGGGPGALLLVAGVALGLLLANLILPDRSKVVRTVVESAAPDAVAAAGDAPAAPGGPHEAAAPASQAGTVTTAAAAGSNVAAAPGAASRQATQSAAGGPATPAASANVVGVTDTSIKIGIAWLQNDWAKAAGQNWDWGNGQDHFTAILQSWKREGLVPVNGRDVQFVFQDYSVLVPETQPSVCTGLTSDQKVFSVITDPSFDTGAVCIAKDHHTPIVAMDSQLEQTYKSVPYLFTGSISLEKRFRNWMQWAHERGLLTGKKIGIFYYTGDAPMVSAKDTALKPELARLGYKVTDEISTDNGQGGGEDSIAVQKFKAEGIDLVIILTPGETSFHQAADQQGYRPAYIASDYTFRTSDTVAKDYPPQQYDGTFGMTSQHRGEWNVGSLNPEAAKCVDVWQKYSGKKLDPVAHEAEYGTMMMACDHATLTLIALQRAGRNLTQDSFVKALESIQNQPMAMHANVSFSPTKHYGQDLQRTEQWHASCQCWHPIGDWGPFWS